MYFFSVNTVTGNTVLVSAALLEFYYFQVSILNFVNCKDMSIDVQNKMTNYSIVMLSISILID